MTTTYQPNSSNELLSTTNPNVTYTYDNNGNTKTKSDGTQYTWDLDNRLTQVVLPGTGGTANFQYDPFGRRIQKAFTQNGTTTTTDYLYDGANILETMNQSGTVLARYVDSLNIDEPLSEVISGTTSYYEQDGLGSVSSLSNSAGALANTYIYDSYGNTTSNATVVNPFQYTGRELDSETGLYFYRARYYDASIGRFLGEDPIGLNGGINFYTYVDNDPLKWTDASGLSPQDVQNLIDKFNNIINRLNNSGLRRVGNGRVNGWINDFFWHSYPWSSKKYLSCGEQAYEVKTGLEGLKTDNKWTIDVIRIESGFGQATQAHSDDPNDPTLIFDPWLDTITTIPPKM